MIDTVEAQVIAYCKQRHIPIKDGRVPQEYKAAINEFVKMQRNKAKALKAKNEMDIKNILKDVMSTLPLNHKKGA